MHLIICVRLSVFPPIVGAPLSGAFMHSSCFMIPVMTLSVSAGMFGVSAVWFALPGNFRMSLSFRVVVVPVVRFLRRYDGVSNP